jgi:hypothetical protein
MKPTNNINRMIKKLHLKASAELDRRVHNDISRALVESEPAVTVPTILKFITKGVTMKLAIAAAIIIAFGIGFSVGQRSRPTQSAIYPLDVANYTAEVSAYPTALKAEDSFWRQKALAAMQPRPYSQNQLDKTSLLNAYKQYFKGETL